MYLYLKVGLYLKGICNYNQIHLKLPTKGKALPDIIWLQSQDRICFTPVQQWAGNTEKSGLQ